MIQPARDRHQKFLDAVRTFNKYIFNHLILMFAESRVGPFSVITHQGRHSGRKYRTPVLASYVGGMVIIPLSYGEHVDWLRNVLAQGGCEIVRRNKRMRLIDPLVLNTQAAYTILPEQRRKLFSRFKVEKFVRLNIDR
jgi:deazaflavin-dependent oxidoreductase (nitroreductase family)